MHVKAATPLPRVRVRHVIPAGELQGFVIALGLVGLHAGPADVFHVEQVCDGQGVVPHKFRVETAWGLRCQEPVGRIDLHRLGLKSTALAIGLTGHDQADHVLHVPTGIAEFAGQPIQKLRVRGQLSLGSEVVYRRAEADPKKLGPKPVHDRPGGDRILRRDDPIRQIQSGQAFRLRAFQSAGKERGRRGKDQGASFILPVPPGQDADRKGIGDGLGDEAPRLAIEVGPRLGGQAMGFGGGLRIKGGAEEEASPDQRFLSRGSIAWRGRNDLGQRASSDLKRFQGAQRADRKPHRE